MLDDEIREPAALLPTNLHSPSHLVSSFPMLPSVRSSARFRSVLKTRDYGVCGKMDSVPENHATVRTLRGIQQSLLTPPRSLRSVTPSESKGVVYTKRWVVELLLDLAGYRAENNLLDALAVEPSAGDGAFLRPMIERLLDSCRRLNKPISACRKSLIAFELDEESASRARILTTAVLTEHGVKLSVAEDLARFWVHTGDYLLDATSSEADFVIGNPPCVRLEDIPEETALFYREAYPAMRGRADLYVAFFEAALRQLNEGGVCAFICADRWMRNQYGAELRQLITAGFSVDVVIEMHNADAFHAITVIRRRKQGSTVVASAGPEVEGTASHALSAALQGTGRGENPVAPNGLRVALVDKWFTGAAPWPCHSPEQLTLLRRLEEGFPALETYAKVGIGVATGNDSVFITKDTGLVEPSRLLKLALVNDICAGTLNWSQHYLVDPWNDDGLVTLTNIRSCAVISRSTQRRSRSAIPQ
jgi:hypothetical protein